MLYPELYMLFMFIATILNCTMFLRLQGTEIQELNLPCSLWFRGPKWKVTTSTVEYVIL